MPTITELLNTVVKEEYLENHGSHAFERISDSIDKKKTGTILAELGLQYYQDPITWDEIKAKVWDTEETQIANKFPFLQGDIIKTTLVDSLGQSEINQKHDLWLLCSPSCDISRGPDYIKVAKIFRVDLADIKKDKETQEHQEFMKLVLGAKFKRSSYFPLPPFPGDPPNTYGYYADLVTPYYLERKFLDFPVTKHSLKLFGWHLLNIFLTHRNTRSNPLDEPKIRCTAEGIPVPLLKREEIRVYHGVGKDDYTVVSKDFIGDSREGNLTNHESYRGQWFKFSDKEVFWFIKDGVDPDKLHLDQNNLM